METLQLFDQREIYQISLQSFVEDFRVKAFPLQGLGVHFPTQEELYFLKSHGFYRIIGIKETPSPIFYSKMLRAYIAQEITPPLLQFMEFLPSLVIMLNAHWKILSITSHRTESVYTLLDILETEVADKYFLSEKAIAQIETSRERGLPSPVLTPHTTKVLTEKGQ